MRGVMRFRSASAGPSDIVLLEGLQDALDRRAVLCTWGLGTCRTTHALPDQWGHPRCPLLVRNSPVLSLSLSLSFPTGGFYFPRVPALQFLFTSSRVKQNAVVLPEIRELASAWYMVRFSIQSSTVRCIFVGTSLNDL